MICLNKSRFSSYTFTRCVKENVIGWYRQRRNTRQQMTFMEQVIHQNMRKILPNQELVFLLLTPSQATASGSTHRLEFSAFLWHSKWDTLNSGTNINLTLKLRELMYLNVFNISMQPVQQYPHLGEQPGKPWTTRLLESVRHMSIFRTESSCKSTQVHSENTF